MGRGRGNRGTIKTGILRRSLTPEQVAERFIELPEDKGVNFLRRIELRPEEGERITERIRLGTKGLRWKDFDEKQQFLANVALQAEDKDSIFSDPFSSTLYNKRIASSKNVVFYHDDLVKKIDAAGLPGEVIRGKLKSAYSDLIPGVDEILETMYDENKTSDKAISEITVRKGAARLEKILEEFPKHKEVIDSDDSSEKEVIEAFDDVVQTLYPVGYIGRRSNSDWFDGKERIERSTFIGDYQKYERRVNFGNKGEGGETIVDEVAEALGLRKDDVAYKLVWALEATSD